MLGVPTRALYRGACPPGTAGESGGSGREFAQKLEANGLGEARKISGGHHEGARPANNRSLIEICEVRILVQDRQTVDGHPDGHGVVADGLRVRTAIVATV